MNRIPLMALGMALALAGRGAAQAPGATDAPRKLLDARSVLVAWTNEAPEPAPTPAPADAGAGSDTNNPQVKRLLDQAADRVRDGNVAGAVELYLQALQIDPKNQRVQFGLGTAYIQQEKYREALGILEPMVLESPQDYFLMNNIAWLYATAKDPSVRDGRKAVRFSRDALLIAPRDYHVWSTLSESYYILGEYAKALRAAEEALRLTIETPTPGANLQEYHRQVDKCKKAVEAMSILE